MHAGANRLKQETLRGKLEVKRLKEANENQGHSSLLSHGMAIRKRVDRDASIEHRGLDRELQSKSRCAQQSLL